MAKIIKSINLLSIYDCDDFESKHNISKDDFKNKYLTISLNFFDNTILNINAKCNGIPGDNAWFELSDDIMETLIGTEFIDVLEIEQDENIYINKHSNSYNYLDVQTYNYDEGKICKINYIKNNESLYYDFLLCSTISHYHGYTDWIELIPDYQVSPSDVFEKNSVILLVGLPGSGKSTYLKDYIHNSNYLLFDDIISYLSLNAYDANVDTYDNIVIGSYNQNTKEFSDTVKYCSEWDDVYSNGMNFLTRTQIHEWLKKSKDNKVIIADAKLCNEGYYKYMLRSLNIYNQDEVINTIIFDANVNVCEERLKERHKSDRFCKSMIELSKLFDKHNSCYINPEIYCNSS